MTVAYMILILALVGAASAVAAFAWMVCSGQLDDVDTPPRRILFDDEPRTACSGDPHARNDCALRGDLRRQGWHDA